MAKVLITDKINDLAVRIVSNVAQVDNLPTMDEDKLCEIIGEYDALLVRSQTKVTKKIIGGKKWAVKQSDRRFQALRIGGGS